MGSTHVAEDARKAGKNIAGMFTNDIIGNSRSEDGKVDRGRVRLFAEGVPDVKEMSDELRVLVRTGGENDTPTRELARFIKEHAERDVPNMKVDLIWRRDRYLRGGDHAPFLNAGYAAIRFTAADVKGGRVRSLNGRTADREKSAAAHAHFCRSCVLSLECCDLTSVSR